MVGSLIVSLSERGRPAVEDSLSVGIVSLSEVEDSLSPHFDSAQCDNMVSSV